MPHPKVQSVEPINDSYARRRVRQCAEKKIRCASSVPKSNVRAFEKPGALQSARVERGGYAVVWNGNIDISEYELWSNGEAIS